MIRWVGRLGRVLVGAGVLMLLFVGYQLWGTGLVEARAQDDLADDFEQLVDPPRGDDDSVEAPGSNPPAPVNSGGERAPGWPDPPQAGSALARLRIPAIDVDKIIVEGVSRDDLRRAPGHYPGTALPGEVGNAAIAGHRTTYGAPFFRLDELESGDEVLLDTPAGEVRYIVSGSEIVPPDRVEVLNDAGDTRLTLTTCNPKYSAAERLIVTAVLAPEEGRTARAPSATAAPERTVVERNSIDEEPASSPPRLPVVLWGLLAAGVALGIWLLGRWWRRWPSYLLGGPVFLVVLVVFFEHLNRLLPPSV